VRKLDKDRYQIIFGTTRYRAVMLIRVGFTVPNTEPAQVIRDPDFKLGVRVLNVSPEKAFVLTITENANRNQTNDLDDALNHEILRTRYGHSAADIVTLYGYKNRTRVDQLQRILTLEAPFRAALNDGNLSLAAAVELASLPPDKRDAALGFCADKVTAANIRAYMREINFTAEEEAEVARVLTAPTPATAADATLSAAMTTTPGEGGTTEANPAPRARSASVTSTRLSAKQFSDGLDFFIEHEETSDDTTALLEAIKKYYNGKLRQETLLTKLLKEFKITHTKKPAA
jgi:ParB-like chromosome segregation protein Spo0J